MPQSCTERPVGDSATKLEKQIGAISRPSHLLGLVHAPVNQRGLAAEVFIDRMQRVPQLARRHALRAPAVLAFEGRHDLADPLDAAQGVLRLAVPNAPVQTLDLGDDHSLRRHPGRIISRQIRSCQLRVLQTHRDMDQSKIDGFITPVLVRTVRRPGQPSVKTVTPVVSVRPTVSRVRWINAGTAASSGVMPRSLSAGKDRWLAGIAARGPNRAYHYRQRNELAAAGRQRWPAKFGQADKWNFCLRAAGVPPIRSGNGKTSTSDPQSG
jgi:hypothetical protein